MARKQTPAGGHQGGRGLVVDSVVGRSGHFGPGGQLCIRRAGPHILGWSGETGSQHLLSRASRCLEAEDSWALAHHGNPSKGLRLDRRCAIGSAFAFRMTSAGPAQTVQIRPVEERGGLRGGESGDSLERLGPDIASHGCGWKRRRPLS